MSVARFVHLIFLARHQSECGQVKDEVATLLGILSEPDIVMTPSSVTPHPDKTMCSTVTDQQAHSEAHSAEAGSVRCFPEGSPFSLDIAETTPGIGEAKQGRN